ncbi:MAG: RidA family protein [Planctomycetes bacterium]|nr:RidA family protein [Planctomycetota bacterium]
MQAIHTDQAPAAIGPYSQAYLANGVLYTSGQIALQKNGEMVVGDVLAEAAQVFANLYAVLAAAGCAPKDVVRATVYLTDLADFADVNKLYADFFGDHKPARACVQVAALPKGAQIEMDVIAHLPAN